jgi:hypothetical protein
MSFGNESDAYIYSQPLVQALGIKPDLSFTTHPRENHLHVNSELCIAFISLMYLREIAPGLARYPIITTLVSSRHSIHAVWLMHHVTGFGHPDCLTCVERYDNARALGYHEGRKMMERAEYKLARKALTSLFERR